MQQTSHNAAVVENKSGSHTTVTPQQQQQQQQASASRFGVPDDRYRAAESAWRGMSTAERGRATTVDWRWLVSKLTARAPRRAAGLGSTGSAGHSGNHQRNIRRNLSTGKNNGPPSAMGHNESSERSQERKTTTTAKSQVMAIICAPITELRRRTSNNNKIGDREEQESLSGNDTNADVGTITPPATHPIIHSVGDGRRCCVPPSSMVKWIQSTAVFRAWAEEWVLRPSDEAVFRLPIREHFLFVSVSPTLGLVRHSWFHTPGDVNGSLGNNRMILRQSRFIRASFLNEHVIEEVGGDGEALKRVSSLQTRCHPLYCNRKWIVGINGGRLHVWQVAPGVGLGDASSSGMTERYFDGLLLGYIVCARFSSFSDDVFLVFESCETVGGSGGSVTFCDLQASVNKGELVVIRKLLCRDRPCCVTSCRTDGSMCTMHYDPYLIVDNATGEPVVQFPEGATVLPIGSSHVFMMRKDAPKFEVFHNGGSLTSTPPTLSVPCTWAAPSLRDQSQLIVSTTHSSESHGRATEIKFVVHDCSTGFHVGQESLRHCLQAKRGLTSLQCNVVETHLGGAQIMGKLAMWVTLENLGKDGGQGYKELYLLCICFSHF
ncbi:hypothetical protein Pelo_6733 [Pelomyxa schiedti]|nr:hypothetical protein Pelo_6733 [Pelomyxa schiedti]